ncbi:copper resistance CopC family protein [Alkalicoccobacillus murimartini]|uniref:Methionine-rich copper-binding protein CopC n=1 Tax=Alkalicoccobacillus murimartini TaxID=171685 RepID=A0ABT9YIC9_9BACI|nr:copper resistance CopC family protein [Alkalicoccobacillus murimartini]MDQ0207461.1 methionine-rich copper-binding protein CopC [Alkalicoccobacillus murimartini]
MVTKEVGKRSLLAALLAIVLLWAFMPTVVSAHSQLESSSPEDGQTLEESIDSVVLEFSAGIESASTITILNEAEEEIPVDINVNASSLDAQTEAPLPNGEYRIVYTILSEDSHPVEGEISFVVNAEEPEESASEEADSDQTEVPPVEEEQEEPVEAPDTDVETESSGFSFIWIVVVVAAIGLIAGVAGRMAKRNK